MEQIFLFPFVVLPVIFGLKIKYNWKNYLTIFIITFCMGGVLGYGIFDFIRGEGWERLIAFVLFYGAYISFFFASLYAIVRHFFKEKLPPIYLASNFGFFLMSFALMSLFALGNEDLFGLYQRLFSIQPLPTNLVSAVVDVSLILMAGAVLAVLAFIGGMIFRSNK